MPAVTRNRPARRDAAPTHRPAARRAGAALVAALALGGLTACSTEEAPTGVGADAAVVHNAADTEFAQMMVIHHEGAIEMSDLAVERAATEDVRALAERISAAQGPEIDTMTGWLEAWGEDMPHDADMSDMGHGGMDMGGLDQDEAMEELRGLEGEDFDRRFLELMIAHHEGALEMAQQHMDDGDNTDAVSLSEDIVEAQEAEIAEMREMLDAL